MTTPAIPPSDERVKYARHFEFLAPDVQAERSAAEVVREQVTRAAESVAFAVDARFMEHMGEALRTMSGRRVTIGLGDGPPTIAAARAGPCPDCGGFHDAAGDPL